MATVVLRTKVILKLGLVSGKFIFTLCRGFVALGVSVSLFGCSKIKKT